MKIAPLLAASAMLASLSIPALAEPTAEDLHAEGQTAYDRREYAVAASKWRSAYALSKEAGVLFNLAQALRLAGDCPSALATYRRFAATTAEPGSEQRVLADDWARELEGQCPAPAPDGASPSPPPLPLPTPLPAPTSAIHRADGARPGRAWKIAGVVTASAGVVALAVGLGLGNRGAAIGDDVTAACASECDWEDLRDDDARGRRYVAVGRALDAVGAVAIVGGAVFYYVGMRKDAFSVSLRDAGSGVAVSWSGMW